MVKSSIYFHLFNIGKFKVNLDEVLSNFCAFADEVVCATAKDEYDSFAKLQEAGVKYQNFKVVLSDVDISSNRFDGDLKTFALKNTTNPIKIIADADEKFVLSQKELWQSLYAKLLENQNIDGFLIPVLDVWGDKNKIRLDKQIGQKFRIHKDTVKSRGVVPFAITNGDKFDVSKSDGTEPLTISGHLAKFVNIVDAFSLNPLFCHGLNGKPYVIHEGYLDFDARVNLNKIFWQSKWADYSGKEENVVIDKNLLELNQTIVHNLPYV